MKLETVVLEGTYVRLEPLSLSHIDALCAVGLDPLLWQWTPSMIRRREEMLTYVETALREQETGSALPFATVNRRTSGVVGSTRFANIHLGHKRVEIGWTWIGLQWQRTPINTEAKYLMLRHAFETLDCNRVELKTDSLNARSRAAILRIGAREEGIFRNHMVTEGGRIRHTVYYSIIKADWAAVKLQLEEKLRRPFDPHLPDTYHA